QHTWMRRNGSGSVGGIFEPTRQNERVSLKINGIPTVEPTDQPLHRIRWMFEPLLNHTPRLALTVQPRDKPLALAAQVSDLVRKQRFELCDRERTEQRDADLQVVPVSTEDTPSRHLVQPQIEGSVNSDGVDGRTMHDSAPAYERHALDDIFDGVEQRGRIVCINFASSRRLAWNAQRPHEHERACAAKHDEQHRKKRGASFDDQEIDEPDQSNP